MQTKMQSAVETGIGMAIGFVLSLVLNWLLWKYRYQYQPVTWGMSVEMTLIFTVVSFIRSFAIRRFFNWWHYREPVPYVQEYWLPYESNSAE